jgi:hypothetical protein
VPDAGITVTGSGNAVASSTGSGSASAHVAGPVAADPSAATLARIEELLAALAAAARASLEPASHAPAGLALGPELPREQAEVVLEETGRLTAEVRRPRRSADHIGLALRNLLRAAAPVFSLLAQANEVRVLVESLPH